MNIRKGIKDVWWRPYMVLGAKFSENDILSCPTTATEMPALILTYKEAKELYRKEMRKHNKDLYWYCFDGIPKHSVVAIGTVGGSPRKLEDCERFEEGLKELVRRLHPHTIIVYGSANYPCFKELEKRGIKILAYPSKSSKVFAGRAK